MEKNLIVNSISYVCQNHISRYKNIIVLSINNMNIQTLRTSLGIGWVFCRDIIYYLAFILFRYLMSGSGSIEGMNFILFLLLGMIPWNFMNECINGGVMAIKSNKQILSSIEFPVVILPTIEIIAIFMKRLFTIIILFVAIIIFGDIHNVTWWMLIYYFFCMFIFMLVWNLVFSSLVAISNDFEQLYRALTSVLFYTLPVMWSFEIISGHPIIIGLFQLNPMVYLISGFRDACQTGILPDFGYSLYFWIFSGIMLCLGSILQYKLKHHYVDFI